MTTLTIKYLYPRSVGGYFDNDDNWIDDDNTDDWEDNYQLDGSDGYIYEALGHCCGAGTHKARDKKVNSKYGIDLFPGKCGTGKSIRLHQRAHVDTKNGPITVCIRLEPWK